VPRVRVPKPGWTGVVSMWCASSLLGGKAFMSDALTEKIIGAAIEVHRVLGPGLVESIYEEALCVELQLRGVNFERQVELGVNYKGHVIKGQRLDLLVEKT